MLNLRFYMCNLDKHLRKIEISHLGKLFKIRLLFTHTHTNTHIHIHTHTNTQNVKKYEQNKYNGLFHFK